jgi:hypothetical protein
MGIPNFEPLGEYLESLCAKRTGRRYHAVCFWFKINKENPPIE